MVLGQGYLLRLITPKCSMCLELIVEIVDDTIKACITICSHIFHDDCLRRHFDEQKNCRKDLRCWAERVAGYSVGLRQVQDPLKANIFSSFAIESKIWIQWRDSILCISFFLVEKGARNVVNEFFYPTCPSAREVNNFPRGGGYDERK